MYLPKTLTAIQNIQQSVKCLSCNMNPPFEPYFTGVCDHLLCKKCLSKNYNCPVCSAAFYQKDTYHSKMLKEAFSYVNGILDLMLEDQKEDENRDKKPRTAQNLDNSNESFPDIDITSDSNDASLKEKAVVKAKPATRRSAGLDTFKSPGIEVISARDAGFKKPALVTPPEPALKPTQSKRRPSMSQRQPRGAPKSNQIAESQKPRTQAKIIKKNDKGETKLHLAVMNNDVEAVRELLRDQNADVNVKDFAGWTALHEACVSGYVEMAKTLIEFGANVNAMGCQNNTPLHEATLNDQVECIRVLFEHGACRKNRNSLGVLPIELAKSQAVLQLYRDFEDKSEPEILLDDGDGDDNISRSQFDTSQSLDISSSRANAARRSGPSKAAKKVLLYPTGMSDEEKVNFTALAGKLKLKVAKEMNSTVTHVVFPGTGNACLRTLSYMKGVLMGIWVVSIKWLLDSCEKGYLVEENSYEATGSSKLPESYGPRKGRLNASCQYAKLFEDCNFYLLGNFKAFEKQEFISLIQLGGGKILKREPKLDRLDELMTDELPDHLEKDFKCSHFILHELTKLREEIRHPYLNSVLPGWLFSCIDEFKILKPE